jgi:hypothetical protein
MFTLSLLAMAVFALAALPAWADEQRPTGQFSVGAASAYVWRGYELSRNSVVIQPSMTIGYQGFSAGIWGNMDTKPYYGGTVAGKSYSGDWNETDVTLSYTKSLGLFNLGAGYIYYGLGALNSDAADRLDGQDIFITASLNTILAPTLTIYKDLDHYRNWYFLLGVSHSLELSEMIALNLAATVSYLLSTDPATYPKFDGNALPTADKFSNFHDGSLSVSLPVKATPYVTVTPAITYVFPLSDDAKQEMKGLGLQGAAAPAGRDSSFAVGSLTVSVAF